MWDRITVGDREQDKTLTQIKGQKNRDSKERPEEQKDQG